ncbi:pirin family protein [Paenibacillus abyssi]|uniref:Pirin n=1 Tax=Paenibacillus abyssi TaxID=1340531 RepID=A0A917CS11_9BACL|nr:pirin family protein [Paenibacillus abyssi]GGF95445.1 hypothetical protein GCM10010916_10970 [Paenibacillus abyssi]
MIKIYSSESRFHTDLGWLNSRLSFPFGEHYDPENKNFGALRVFNDDIVAGNRGFGGHPHREMEIVTIVLSGQLKHEDSTGHVAVTGFGGIQRMSAGTGIIHSEVNPGDEEVKLLQLWFTPERKGLPPSYETSQYEPAKMRGALLPVVSKQSGPGIAHINQDLTIYLSDIEAGQTLRTHQPASRRIYVFVLEGEVLLSDEHRLNRRDSARITEVSELTITAQENARFMLIDLP